MTLQLPEELDALLAVVQPSLRTAGEPQGVWTRLRCTCGRPECEIHDPDRHSVTLQLDTLAAYWSETGAGADLLPRALAPLAGYLDVETEGVPADPQALLHRIRDLWLASMGTPLGGAPDEEWLRDLERVEARNTLLLDQLLARVAGASFHTIAEAGAAHARWRQGRLAAEGLTGCLRTLRAWIADHDVLPQRTLLREHLLALLEETPWTAGEARDVVQMMEDAAAATLAFGIAGDVWVRAAYGHAEDVAPFSALRVALVLEDG